MGERSLDAIAGMVFIIIILALEYLKFDIGFAKAFIWVFAILFHAHVFGKHALPNRPWYVASPVGLILLMAAQSVIQTVWYYTGNNLGSLSDAWSLVLALAFSHLTGLTVDSARLSEEAAAEQPLPMTHRRRFLAGTMMIAALGCMVFVVHGAWMAHTVQTIRTPWPLLPTGSLFAIALLWILVAISAIFVQSWLMTGLQSIMALAATFSLAPLIYRIGYGFDGFLHLAGEQILLKTGTLNPKPFYYMGQYVFTTWISRMTDLPLADIDRWLVPLLAAFMLAASTVLAFDREEWRGSATAALALFPLGMFVATTPQGLATVLGLCALILSLGSHKGSLQFGAVFWLGVWSIAIHPLAGVPLLGLAIAVQVVGNRNRHAKHFCWPIALLAGLSIPAVFYVASRYGNALAIDWNLDSAFQASVWVGELGKLLPWLGNKYTLWPAWSSLVALALPAIGLVTSIISLILLKKNDRVVIGVLLVGAFSLLFSAGLLAKAGDFTFLIQYEKGDYAQRLWQIAVFILLLGGVPALSKLLGKVRTAMPLASAMAVVLFASIGAANAYNSLPRHDATQASRGWSTSADDIEAVRWIDRYAKDAKYTVLADQSVSAAAVNEFGFKRYAGDVFFYPIPTGGPLYGTYLKMTYEDPSWDTVRDAAKLGQSDLVFVVINDYWWKAEELNQRIGQIAQASWSIDDGKVNIYVFDVAKPPPEEPKKDN